jgi:hypothetical protein
MNRLVDLIRSYNYVVMYEVVNFKLTTQGGSRALSAGFYSTESTDWYMGSTRKFWQLEHFDLVTKYVPKGRFISAVKFVKKI